MLPKIIFFKFSYFRTMVFNQNSQVHTFLESGMGAYKYRTKIFYHQWIFPKSWPTYWTTNFGVILYQTKYFPCDRQVNGTPSKIYNNFVNFCNTSSVCDPPQELEGGQHSEQYFFVNLINYYSSIWGECRLAIVEDSPFQS